MRSRLDEAFAQLRLAGPVIVVNLSMMIGDRQFGLSGALAALGDTAHLARTVARVAEAREQALVDRDSGVLLIRDAKSASLVREMLIAYLPHNHREELAAEAA